MDPELARRFNLDRPIAVRVLERRIKEDFVKSANHSGLDLTKLSADEVTGLYDQYRHLFSIRMNDMVKVAEAIRAGRALALGIIKAAQVQPTPEFLHKIKSLREFLGSGTPEALAWHRKLVQEPELLKRLITGGALGEAGSARLVAQSGMGAGAAPDAAEAMIKQLLGEEGSKAGHAAHGPLRAQLGGFTPAPTARAPVPADVLDELISGKLFAPGAAAQEAALMKSWSPKGLGAAFGAKNWGAVARKGGPLAAGGAGLLYLLGKRRESQDAARAGMMGMPGSMGMQGMGS